MAAILIMEDDVLAGLHLSDMLSAEGHYIVHTSMGSEALEKLADEQFDLIIADLLVKQDGTHVPDGGLMLISRVRMADPPLRDIPIIAVSGAVKMPGLESILDTAEVVGATATLAKPLSPEKLNGLIEKLIAQD